MHCHAHPGNKTKTPKNKEAKTKQKTPNTKTTQTHKTRNKQPSQGHDPDEPCHTQSRVVASDAP